MNINTMTLEQVAEKVSQLLDRPEDWVLNFHVPLSELAITHKNIPIVIKISNYRKSKIVTIMTSSRSMRIDDRMLTEKVNAMYNCLFSEYERSAKDNYEFLKEFNKLASTP